MSETDMPYKLGEILPYKNYRHLQQDYSTAAPGTVLPVREIDSGIMRTFATGATRDTADGKLDYEGFLSPAVLERFAEYMHRKRVQPDGSLRDGDNWQKGIPIPSYMQSMWRHFMDVWKAHRGLPAAEQEEALCALLFNVQGYLHELLKEKRREQLPLL